MGTLLIAMADCDDTGECIPDMFFPWMDYMSKGLLASAEMKRREWTQEGDAYAQVAIGCAKQAQIFSQNTDTR